MSDARYLNLTEEKEATLRQFRENVADVLQPSQDDRFLLRWLRARNFSLANAEKMLREDVRFRKERRSDQLTKKNSMRQAVRLYTRLEFLGFDYEGHPVHLFNMKSCDCKGFARSCTLKEATDYFISLAEENHKLLKEHNEKTGRLVETAVFIADIGGLNVTQLYDKQVMNIIRDCFKIFQDHYPEMLHVIYVVNAPKLFLYIFAIFKTFVDEAVINKFKLYGDDDGWQDTIFEAMPKDIIPGYLGGTRFEPEGDPYCHAFLNWDSPVPRTLYLKNSPPMDVTEVGVKEKMVPPRSIFEIDQHVTTVPSVLTWEFQTKGYDIKFGLYFRPTCLKDENTDIHELIPTKNVDCGNTIEKSEYICEAPGTYVLTFDNKQSWFTAKHLLYKTEVRSSSEICQ